MLNIRYVLHTSKRFQGSLRDMDYFGYISCTINLRTPLLHRNKLCAKINGFKVCSLIFRHNYYPNHVVVQALI